MNSAKPSSLTIEEAVALMINLDYIPTGFSLLELLAAFQEEAEVKYQNAKMDLMPPEQLAILAIRNNACKARHSLAQLLMEHLHKDVATQESSIFVSHDPSIKPLLSFKNISDWASEHYGIDLQEKGIVTSEPILKVSWEAITIKIYAEYKIGYSIEKGSFKRKSFQDIGLMGKRKFEPNHIGGLLIGLSLKKKFPAEKHLRGSDVTAISKLRRALKQLTGVSSDPFYKIDKDVGLKPKFKLIDDRHNADERARDRASHIPFDESRDFEHEDDAAQRYIDNQD